MKRLYLIVLICNLLSISLFAYERKPKEYWLPDYKEKVGLMYGFNFDANSNYIWRGFYVSALGFQTDATIGYGGLYMNMWWNLSATDWKFTALMPEVDMSIGFSRWGLNVYFIHMYYFDHYADGSMSRFFDFGNHAPSWDKDHNGGGGTTSEWRISYRVSDNLPLSIMLCTRTFGRDGYYKDGELKRAYSSYIELGYDFNLPHDLCLAARLGMTPWTSCYTNFQGTFAVCNISARLTWSYELSSHWVVSPFAHLMLNPYDLSHKACINDKENPILWNIGCSIHLK